MGVLSLRRQAAYTFLLFTLLLLLLLVPRAGHESDMSFWVAWAKDIYYQGLGNVYQSPSNSYNPLYVLVSVACFLNLEGVLRYLELKKYTVLVFDSRFVAGLFALIIVLGFIKLCRSMIWRENWPLIQRPPRVEVAA